MESYLQAMTAYFSVHANLALAAVFAAAALEACALIGTVIPGSTVVFIGGVLIALNVLDPWWTAAAAVAGAVLGDGISYWLGRRYRERLRTVWPISRYPALLERGRAYFAANGGKSVFFGRFITPVRAIVPVIAGMSGMPPAPFYLMNIASALAWSVVHIVPGILFGASLQVAGAVSSRLIVVVLVISVASWLMFRLLRMLLRRGWGYFIWLRDGIVRYARRSPGPAANLALSLFDPARPESSALLTAALALIAGGWLFLGIVEDVVSNDPLVRFDSSVSALLESLRTQGLDGVMIAITELGGPIGTVALLLTLSLYFAFRGYWRTLGYWLAAAGFAEALVWVLKLTLGRARPHSMYTGAEQFSFPSGHATLSIVIYGFLGFLLASGKSARGKTAVTMAAAAVIALISSSRLYLGAHWLSDVLGSLSLGLFWVALLSIAHLHHVRGERVAVLPVVLIVCATLVSVGSLYPGARQAEDLKSYSYHSAVTPAFLPDWKDEGWQLLPPARSEVDGDLEEPFSIQWTGSAAEVAQTLAAAGWQTPQQWSSKGLLLWLVPHTPIAQLPVFPKFDHGQAQKLIFVKVLDNEERSVMRLWPAPYQVPRGAGLPPAPLWAGTLTREHLRRLPGLTLARTEVDFLGPVEELQKELQFGRCSIKRRSGSDPGLLLIW